MRIIWLLLILNLGCTNSETNNNKTIISEKDSIVNINDNKELQHDTLFLYSKNVKDNPFRGKQAPTEPKILLPQPPFMMLLAG